MDAAHALGKRIAIHSYGPMGARDAVRAGADSIEHATDMDDETIAEMVRNKVYYVPTAFLRLTRKPRLVKMATFSSPVGAISASLKCNSAKLCFMLASYGRSLVGKAGLCYLTTMAVNDKQIEATKVWVDCVKHLTTLSTGSILLIATFLEKIFAKPLWKSAVVVAVIGFLANIFGAAMFFSIQLLETWSWYSTEEVPLPLPTTIVALIGMILVLLGFGVGMVSLALFAIRNLL